MKKLIKLQKLKTLSNNLSRASQSNSIVIEKPMTLRELEAVPGAVQGSVNEAILGVEVVIVTVIIIVIMMWSVTPLINTRGRGGQRGRGNAQVLIVTH